MSLLRSLAVLGFVIAPSSLLQAQTSTMSAASRTMADTGSTSAGVTVTGVVFDSVAQAPLAGAMIQMGAEAGDKKVYGATTDSTGAYRIDGVPSGSYLVTFFHPALEGLGLRPLVRRALVGSDSAIRVDYAIPSAQTIRAVICAPRTPSDSSGLLIGHLNDADSGAPLTDGQVAITWDEVVIDQRGLRPEHQQLVAHSNGDGLYALCGVPTEATVLARAERGASASGFVQIQVPARGLVQRDFRIGSADSMVAVAPADSAGGATSQRSGRGSLWRGTARLEGIVRTPAGDPMSDVQLVLRGSTEQTMTDARGTFTLSNLPPGTFTLEARHLGFEPKRVAVDLASHHTSSITLTLDKEVPVLNTVHVYGKEQGNRTISGFLQRRQQGIGHFITRADIEKRHPIDISEMFRTVPGVDVIPLRGFGHRILIRGLSGLGACQPSFYIDGMSAFLPDDGNVDDLVFPDEIVGIEVYKGESESPMQFEGHGCGVVLIWTGMGAPQ